MGRAIKPMKARNTRAYPNPPESLRGEIPRRETPCPQPIWIKTPVPEPSRGRRAERIKGRNLARAMLRK